MSCSPLPRGREDCTCTSFLQPTRLSLIGCIAVGVHQLGYMLHQSSQSRVVLLCKCLIRLLSECSACKSQMSHRYIRTTFHPVERLMQYGADAMHVDSISVDQVSLRNQLQRSKLPRYSLRVDRRHILQASSAAASWSLSQACHEL